MYNTCRRCMISRVGMTTPSDEYDSYREYRVANIGLRIRICIREYTFSQRLLISLDSVPNNFALTMPTNFFNLFETNY